MPDNSHDIEAEDRVRIVEMFRLGQRKQRFKRGRADKRKRAAQGQPVRKARR